VPRFRICKTFTVESGHMLSKHPERCRFPHGHTRQIEVIVSSESLDANDMVVDFKALRLAVEEYVERYDHSIAINSADPLLPDIQRIHPDSAIVFENIDPTTEVIAKDIYDFVAGVLSYGFEGLYTIPAGKVQLDRVRVWETPSSWAEYGD
jgi:6-pyruvoyltetrahydropterin/6-carboxytetrahydropterin synthase